MGTWSFYLRKDEEKEIKRLVAEGKFPSVYSFTRYAIHVLLVSIKEAEKENYWWRQPKNKV